MRRLFVHMEETEKPNFLKRVLRRKWTIIIIILLMVGFFAGKNIFFPSTNGFESSKVERGIVAEELILSGEVKADEHANLNFLTSGELDYVGVTEGAEVKKGDVLAKLDATVLYQAYLSAESDLRRFDASKDKTYDDVQGHSTDETFEQIESRTIAETNRDKAYRAYVAAQQNLSNATLRAPFDGIIASVKHPYTGINTSLTESQIEIVNLESVYFEVSADQSEVTQISKGQKVNIILDSFSDDQFEGEVSYIGFTPKVGEVGAVYQVKVILLGEGVEISKFRVGMTGDAKFVLSQKDDVLFVPTDFVSSDARGKYLKVGKVNNKTYIETGLEGETKTEIVGGIKEGDIIFD